MRFAGGLDRNNYQYKSIGAWMLAINVAETALEWGASLSRSLCKLLVIRIQ
jgi:hypothetical protein